MGELRGIFWKSLGTFLVSFTLCLQLMLAGAVPLRLAAADPINSFGEHALCLAAANSERAPVAPNAPDQGDQHHHHGLFCCLWHPLPGLQPAGSGEPHPVIYLAVVSFTANDTPFAAGTTHLPANARAPPPIA